MNELRDLIEVTGNIVEEAWNNGRREALKEAGIDKLREENERLRETIDKLRELLGVQA